MDRTAVYDLYAHDYLFMDGVYDAIFTPSDGSPAVNDVKVREGDWTREQLANISDEFLIDTFDFQLLIFDVTLGGNNPKNGKFTIPGGRVFRTLVAKQTQFRSQWISLLLQDR